MRVLIVSTYFPPHVGGRRGGRGTPGPGAEPGRSRRRRGHQPLDPGATRPRGRDGYHVARLPANNTDRTAARDPVPGDRSRPLARPAPPDRGGATSCTCTTCSTSRRRRPRCWPRCAGRPDLRDPARRAGQPPASAGARRRPARSAPSPAAASGGGARRVVVATTRWSPRTCAPRVCRADRIAQASIGIDTEAFAPGAGRRAACGTSLGLPAGVPLALFVGPAWSTRRATSS